MMNKSIFVWATSLCLMVSVSGMRAGDKLSLKTITSGEFRSEVMQAVCPLPDGETYGQISSDGKRVESYSFRTGKQVKVLFDVATAQGAKLERIDDYIMSPDGRRMLIQTQTKSIYRHSFTAVFYIYDILHNILEPLSDGGPQQTPVFSPDGNLIAFVRDNNIYLVNLLSDRAECQVTMDGKRNEIINGIPDWVYEEEFSTNSSMVFSADSRQIVWIRYDERAVKQYSMQLFKGLKPERKEFAEYPGAYTYKYPVPGEANSKVSVWSYDVQSCQIRQIEFASALAANADFNFNSSGLKFFNSRAVHFGKRIYHCDDNPFDSRLNNRVDTRRRLALVRTRLKRHIHSRALSEFSRHFQGVDFSMSFPISLMPAFADNEGSSLL